jgi:hypothetical protein
VPRRRLLKMERDIDRLLAHHALTLAAIGGVTATLL